MSEQPPEWPDVTAETRVGAPLPPPPPPAGPPLEPEPGNRIGLGMLLAIGVLVLVAAVIAAILLTRHHHHAAATTTTTILTTTASTPTTTQHAALKLPVPDLVGQPSKVAIAGLRNAGFHISFATVPSALPRGTVVAQNPAGGTKVARGSSVRLNISSGSTSATSTTTTTSSKPGTTTTTTSTTQATSTTQPATTTVAASATVPSLSGQVQSAVQQLYNAGLVASIAYVPSQQPLGTVVAQSPTSGASAKTGSQVTVNASSGPNNNTQETIPNVVGQRIPQAVPMLQHAGLRLIFLKKKVSDRSKAGVIVAQTPAAGGQAPKNAQILVYLGAFQG